MGASCALAPPAADVCAGAAPPLWPGQKVSRVAEVACVLDACSGAAPPLWPASKMGCATAMSAFPDSTRSWAR
eukprot:scaffold139791_cov22-Tisochrysis_lutea.AAC.1